MLNEKYSKPYFLQKNSYWFLSSDTPCPSTNDFSQFFQHKLKNICKVFLLKSTLIQKKILWRINFVFIKFSPKALLFEKLQNECKNPSLLHKATCIRSDHAGAVAKFHVHGSILQEVLIRNIKNSKNDIFDATSEKSLYLRNWNLNMGTFLNSHMWCNLGNHNLGWNRSILILVQNY